MNSAFATSSRPNGDAKDSAHDDARVERERFQEAIPRRVAAHFCQPGHGPVEWLDCPISVPIQKKERP